MPYAVIVPYHLQNAPNTVLYNVMMTCQTVVTWFILVIANMTVQGLRSHHDNLVPDCFATAYNSQKPH